MSHSVALVGLGQVAMGYDLDIADPDVVLTHARAFAGHPAFRLAAGVDCNAARRRTFEERYGVTAVAQRTGAAEVVVIATPTETHGEILREVLGDGKPAAIVCEKPLSYDLAEARAMMKLARDRSCQIYVNYLRRSAPGVRAVKARIEDGRIAWPIKGAAWYSKGLLHNGSHLVNMLEFWLGPIRGIDVLAKGRDIGPHDWEPDVRISFARGDVTFLAAREEDFSLNEVDLIAANGRLRYSATSIDWCTVVPDPLVPGYRVLAAKGEELAADTQKIQWHVADQLAAALAGKDAALCSGEQALATLEWLTKAKDAA